MPIKRKWQLPPIAVMVGIVLIILLSNVFRNTAIHIAYSDFLPSWLLMTVKVLLIIDGILLILLGVRVLRKANTPVPTFNEPVNLVTKGVYKYTRNPIYLGMAELLLVCSLYSDSIITILIPLLFILLAHLYYVPFEEKQLFQRFDIIYKNYQSQVRRWL
ncbi:MAG: methyltransferase [Methylacidiphilales bacterium]|nr:methyltransferase [Candidatus Methylacidiphilales bacterium]